MDKMLIKTAREKKPDIQHTNIHQIDEIKTTVIKQSYLLWQKTRTQYHKYVEEIKWTILQFYFLQQFDYTH